MDKVKRREQVTEAQLLAENAARKAEPGLTPEQNALIAQLKLYRTILDAESIETVHIGGVYEDEEEYYTAREKYWLNVYDAEVEKLIVALRSLTETVNNNGRLWETLMAHGYNWLVANYIAAKATDDNNKPKLFGKEVYYPSRLTDSSEIEERRYVSYSLYNGNAVIVSEILGMPKLTGTPRTAYDSKYYSNTEALMISLILEYGIDPGTLNITMPGNVTTLKDYPMSQETRCIESMLRHDGESRLYNVDVYWIEVPANYLPHVKSRTDYDYKKDMEVQYYQNTYWLNTADLTNLITTKNVDPDIKNYIIKPSMRTSEANADPTGATTHAHATVSTRGGGRWMSRGGAGTSGSSRGGAGGASISTRGGSTARGRGSGRGRGN